MIELIKKSKNNYYLKYIYNIFNGYYIHIWHQTSKKGDNQITIHSESGSNLAELKKNGDIAIDNFEKGLCRCVKCHKIFDYEKIKSNQYYAGIYCDKCWNKIEFKRQRSNDNYD